MIHILQTIMIYVILCIPFAQDDNILAIYAFHLYIHVDKFITDVWICIQQIVSSIPLFDIRQ